MQTKLTLQQMFNCILIYLILRLSKDPLQEVSHLSYRNVIAIIALVLGLLSSLHGLITAQHLDFFLSISFQRVVEHIHSHIKNLGGNRCQLFELTAKFLFATSLTFFSHHTEHSGEN